MTETAENPTRSTGVPPVLATGNTETPGLPHPEPTNTGGTPVLRLRRFVAGSLPTVLILMSCVTPLVWLLLQFAFHAGELSVTFDDFRRLAHAVLDPLLKSMADGGGE